MRSLLTLTMILSTGFAFAVEDGPRMVIKRKLPSKPKATVSVTDADVCESLSQYGIPIEWNEVMMDSAPLLSEAPRKAYLYAPKWCPLCPPVKKALGKGDDDLEIVVVESEVQQIGVKNPMYPALWDARGKKFYYLKDGIKSLDTVKKLLGVTSNNKAVGSFSAGKLQRSFLDPILKRMGKQGLIDLDNAEEPYPVGIANAVLPASLKAEWTTSNNILKMTFDPQPRIMLYGFNQNIRGLTYDGAQITLDLPRMVDPVITIMDGDEPAPESRPLENSPQIVASVMEDDMLAEYEHTLTIDPSYPVRSGWWTHPGGRNKRDLISHLMSGEHAGKFDRAWLESLSVSQLESLHTDDHEHRVKWNSIPQTRVSSPPRSRTTRATRVSRNCPNCPA